MKNGGGSSALIKISAFLIVSVVFFYLGKRFSDVSLSQQISFSTLQGNREMPPTSSSIALSPNSNKTFDLSLNLNETVTPHASGMKENDVSPPPHRPPQLKVPAPPSLLRMGVVDENGRMTDDFEVGEYDPEVLENWTRANETPGLERGGGIRVRIKKFPVCAESMSDYIPCLDNEKAIGKLSSTGRGEKFERHCPEKGEGLNCLIPAPKGYKNPIPWPRSRDEVWFSNVPHALLTEDKGGQNWIVVDKKKFKFPGGGTQFINGADQYPDQIQKMLPEIAFGRHTRVVLDVGCGIASFGSYLMSRNVITLSIAPKDVHESQIQFALERGVPAMVVAFATRRLLYPSQAFDLIHCSRCRINWTRDDGILLLEVNRMLRGGGYFVWAAQPVYKDEEVLEEQWKDLINLTRRLCWNLVKREGYIALWQKPFNNSCYMSREEGMQPPLCEPNDDPDNVWYVNLKACIARLPEEGYGSNVATWPERLQNPPDRLQSIQFDAYLSRKELYRAESRYWKEIIEGYVRVLHWKKFKLRNVLDMRAGFGGFAAALIENNLDCWVLNIVPISEPNTLPVIYDRGLIGVMHDWCEPFDTYPRTYDLIHAAGLFSVERNRCNISTIMLEMDRMLRPGGHVYIRDSLSVMDELKEIGTALGWHVSLRDTSEGPHASYRILTCDKRLRLK
ncbi:probable methyltransferase PMT11 [Primulina huaijiensis]|uniref:probable methyltransferase PMT11 n=1 Tax=Primulina huaijiensis TaxID=1492673 RepID=UPI003CC6E95A